MHSSKIGTRMSLNDRFKMIRQEQQKREIIVNPLIESPQNLTTREKKNFHNTVSRADRPAALLFQGSERNRRLVLQMASNAALMDEILEIKKFKGNFQTILPRVQNVHARLGLANTFNQNTQKVISSNIKNRLGITRKPVLQRLGQSPKVAKAKARAKFNNAGNIQRQHFLKNQLKNSRNARVRNGVRPMKNKPKKTIKRLAANRKKNTLTVEKLNQDLDGYMNNKML